MVTNPRISRILVTDGHHLAGLGAIRSLGRAGYSVVAGCPEGEQHPAGSWSRYWTKEIRYPDPRMHQLDFQSWLRHEAGRGSFDAVLPVSEASVFGVAAVRRKPASGFAAILPDDSALEYTLSKFRSTSLALSLGITCPPTVFISSENPAEKSNDDLSILRFPIFIKIDNYLTIEGAYEPGRAFFAANADQASKILTELEDIRTGIIAQEVIPGYGTGAFLLRFNGKIYLNFAHRRLHEVPYTGGVSSFRESIKDEELVKISASILDAMNYDGVAMVEFRRSPKDGRPYFLEINGRLWGSLALALHSGADFPKALIECYESGAPAASAGPYRIGVKCRNMFRGEISHLFSIFKASSKRSEEPLPSKVNALVKFIALTLNPTIRHDYFWWSDPIPGVVQATRTIRWITVRAIVRLRHYRRSRQLRKLWLQHQLRCLELKYFSSSPKRVLFLCYGNICRSPFAEHLWNAKMRRCMPEGPTAVSAGFHSHADRKPPNWALQIAAEHGVNLNMHRSRVVTKSLIDSVDAIFLMDQANYRELIRQFPSAKHKTYFLGLFAGNGHVEIEDPFTMSKGDAIACYKKLAEATERLMHRLIEDHTKTLHFQPSREKSFLRQRN